MIGIFFGLAVLGGAAFGWSVTLLIAGGLACLRLRVAVSRSSFPSILLIVAGALLGASRGEARPAITHPAWADTLQQARGTVTSSPTIDGRRQRFWFDVAEVKNSDGWIDQSGCAVVSAPMAPRISYGDLLWVDGSAQAVSDLSPSSRDWITSRGCGASLFLTQVEVDQPGRGWRRHAADVRSSMGRALARGAPGDAGALLTGLVTGDDDALSPNAKKSFLATGTTHLTAVSASNLALIVSIVTTTGASVAWHRRFAWQFAAIVAIWLYAVITGFEPPVYRAALVASAALCAVRFGRSPDFLTLNMIAAATMAIVDPSLIWMLSFQLSFAASLAISAAVLKRVSGGWSGWSEVAVLTVVAAQISTLPLTIHSFGTLSITSLPANLIVGPMIAVTYPTAMVAAVVGSVLPALGDALALPAALGARSILWVIEWFGQQQMGVLQVRPTGRTATIFLSCFAVAVVTATSADGRRWIERTFRSTTHVDGEGVIGIFGVLVGCVAFALVRWLIR